MKCRHTNHGEVPACALTAKSLYHNLQAGRQHPVGPMFQHRGYIAACMQGPGAILLCVVVVVVVVFLDKYAEQ